MVENACLDIIGLIAKMWLCEIYKILARILKIKLGKVTSEKQDIYTNEKQLMIQ